MNEKRCRGCKKVLPIDSYYKKSAKCKQCTRKRIRESQAKHWEKKLAMLVRQQDGRKSITPDQIREIYDRQDGLCYWSGLKMEPSPKPRWLWQPSLDRLDNSKLHTPDNVVLCCQGMNLARNAANIDLWRQFLNQIRYGKDEQIQGFFQAREYPGSRTEGIFAQAIIAKLR